MYLYHAKWWKSMYYRVAAVLRKCKLTGSGKRLPDFPHATGSLMRDLKVDHETSTNDVVVTGSVFVSCHVTSDVV